MNDFNNLKKILKGAGIVLIGLFIAKILAYVYRIISARYLGPEGYGLLALSIAILSLLTIFVNAGIKDGLLRNVSYYLAQKNRKKVNDVITSSFHINLIISLIISVFLFIYSESIALFFSKPELIIIFKIMAFVLPFSVMTLNFSSLVRNLERVSYEVYINNILGNLLKIGLFLLIVYFGYNIIGAIFSYFLSIILICLLFYYFINKYLIKIEIFKNSSGKKELFLFSLPIMFSNLFDNILVWTDTIFLGYFLTADKVGIYNVALPFAQLLYLIPTALLSLFIPIITIYFSKKNDIKKLISHVMKWLIFLNAPILTILIFFPSEIINLLFGIEYISASTSLIILSVGYFISSINLIPLNLLIVFKRTKTVLFNAMITLSINLVLSIILIKLYGMVGAAISIALTFLIGFILLTIELYKETKFLKISHLKAVLFSIISALITRFTFEYFEINPYLSLIIAGVTFAVIYILLVLITKSLEKEDIQLINIIKGKLMRR